MLLTNPANKIQALPAKSVKLAFLGSCIVEIVFSTAEASVIENTIQLQMLSLPIELRAFICFAEHIEWVELRVNLGQPEFSGRSKMPW